MTILVVGDDELMRRFVRTVLERDGFQTIEAVDAIDGYQIIQEIGDSIDQLLNDINMPRMDGLALAQLTAESFPDMPILLITQNPSTLPDDRTRSSVLEKPFLLHDLIRAVRSVQT
jgi:CheY-like chemotaxis protein